MTAHLPDQFPGMIDISDDGLTVRAQARPLARIIARQLDAYEMSESGHSHAV